MWRYSKAVLDVVGVRRFQRKLASWRLLREQRQQVIAEAADYLQEHRQI